MDRVKTTTESGAGTAFSTGTGIEKLLITAQAGSEFESSMALLERVNDATSPASRIALESVPASDVSRVVERLEHDSGIHLLVFYLSAPDYVSAAIDNGQAPSEALAQWLVEVETLVSAIRRIRRRVSVIDHAMALAAPSEMVAHLNERLGLALSSAATVDDAAAAAGEAGPLQRMIAAYAVQNDHSARRMQSELAAMTLPIHDGNAHVPSADQAWSSLGSVQTEPRAKPGQFAREGEDPESKRDRAVKERDELKEENDLLLRNLHQVQEELESFYLEGGELEKKLRKTSTEKQRAEKKLRDVEFRLTTKDRKIEAMRRSLSWRLTKPLRAVSKLFKRR